MLFKLVILSVWLSLDVCGAGVILQKKRIQLLKENYYMVGLISMFVILASSCLKNICKIIYPYPILKILQVSILTLIGITFVKNSLFGQKNDKNDSLASKKITGFETVLLGIVVSFDSFGLSLSLSRGRMFIFLLAFFVGAAQVLFLFTGRLLSKESKVIQKIGTRFAWSVSGGLFLLAAYLKGMFF